jgi:citrate lyase subunit beta/citryl-CoA lyase
MATTKRKTTPRKKTARRPARAKTKRKTTARRSASTKRKAATGAKGEAGRRGSSVRSDVYVSVTIKRSGSLDIRMKSKVEAMYGESIRKTAEGVLSAYGVTRARVVIEDQGAVPYVVSARIETALRRAGREGDARPKRTVALEGSTARDRLRRSRLYLPGGEPKFFPNAGIHKPDAVILDLEDSVHPDDKDGARLIVRNALRCVDFMGAERMVRINQLPLGLDDLDEIVPEHPDLILIPKVETADQVRDVHNRIATILKRRRNKNPIWLMPILESALGVENAFEIAGAADSVVALTIGLEDYTADLGVRKTVEGGESLFARSRLVNAARAVGVQAIDSVFGDVEDMDGLRSWGERSRGLGFEGMGCIHPRQIRVIHKAYAPTSAEIDRALKIVAAFDDAKKKGLGVVSLGTRMIDRPVVLRAQRLVEVARRTGLITD